jgi:NAD(P)-dependent dehydrogenase (short-subunit alcohol dehydrogenase family)
LALRGVYDLRDSPKVRKNGKNKRNTRLSLCLSKIMVEQTLSGKVAIVTGSSSGIGAAIVRELSSRGANTVVSYPFPHLKHEADAVVASLPSPAVAVLGDMFQIETPRKLVDAALAQWKRIDILVNSVGLAVNKPFEEQTLEDWDLLVNVNGRGTFLMTQAVLPHLTKGAARIVNIASISARGPPPNQTIYAGTKGMVDSFTKCW